MNQSDIFNSLLSCSSLRHAIHQAISDELSGFTKPAIDPDNYTVNSNMAALLMICSPSFRTIIPVEQRAQFNDVCQDIATRFGGAFPESRTAEWVLAVERNRRNDSDVAF